MSVCCSGPGAAHLSEPSGTGITAHFTLSTAGTSILPGIPTCRLFGPNLTLIVLVTGELTLTICATGGPDAGNAVPFLSAPTRSAPTSLNAPSTSISTVGTG